MKGFTLDLFAFFIGLGIGLLYICLYNPPEKEVVAYPTPYNTGSLKYKDSANNCFHYVATKVACTENAKAQPISSTNE